MLLFMFKLVLCHNTGEDRNVERLTFKQLYEETKIYAAALRKMGLKIGDRVACKYYYYY